METHLKWKCLPENCKICCINELLKMIKSSVKKEGTVKNKIYFAGK
jgi:hypothetical protein